MSLELEAEDIRVGDTVRIEHRTEDMRGNIVVERIIRTEEYLDTLKGEIRAGYHKAVYLLERPLPTEPGLYYRNVYNDDEPLYASCIYQLREGGNWYDNKGEAVSDDFLEYLKDGRFPLVRLVFEE